MTAGCFCAQAPLGAGGWAGAGTARAAEVEDAALEERGTGGLPDAAAAGAAAGGGGNASESNADCDDSPCSTSQPARQAVSERPLFQQAAGMGNRHHKNCTSHGCVGY